jgi:hypothetical protein
MGSGVLSRCKSVPAKSATKDVTLSSAALDEPLAVIWSDSDGKVHYGLCNVEPADRNCPGIQEPVGAVPIADYKDKLIAAILNKRPKVKKLADVEYSELNLLRTKIKRITTKIASGSLSEAEKNTLNAQLVKYNADLTTKSALTADEQRVLDQVLDALNSGKSMTLDQGEDLYVLAIVPFGLGLGVMSDLPLPPPGSIKNQIEYQKVLAAWDEVADTFYGPDKKVYAKDTADQPVDITSEPISNCLSACPPYFSDLVCHFYCWHPSYKKVSPNVRGCFTSIARDNLVSKPNGANLNLYPEVFDYCMYQEFDQAYDRKPAYNESLIAQRKSTNQKSDRVGVLKYMSKRQEDAFKYIMFHWYNPFAFDEVEEQKLMDEFYSKRSFVPHKVNRANKANHPRYAQILPFMQAQYASGRFGPVPAPAGSATSCPSGGSLVDGYCWYFAEDGASCDNACAKVGLASDEATKNYVGSGGSDLYCGRVAAAFGESYAGGTPTKKCPPVGCAKCDGSCKAPLTNTVFRCSGVPTNTSSSSPGVRPFCACH